MKTCATCKHGDTDLAACSCGPSFKSWQAKAPWRYGDPLPPVAVWLIRENGGDWRQDWSVTCDVPLAKLRMKSWHVIGFKIPAEYA